ncbi:MAG: HD domain-containing protein [Bacteroidetes bacterium]|nr:HD domain-containing protein [Bacteroidota bacterium]
MEEKIDYQIFKEAEKHVMELLENGLSKDKLFHTKKHTRDVLKNAEIIAAFQQLPEDDLNILRVSALFHDTGYVIVYENHELVSVAYAEEFLRSRQVSESIISQVKEAILATQIPQKPNDLIGEMLCDADLMHLTYDDYFEVMELMRQEWANVGVAKLNPHDFHMNSIRFFNAHHFYSEYGKKVLQPKKAHTLELLQKKVSRP